MVVRAERQPYAGDPVDYHGPVSLKLLTGTTAEQVAALQERWHRLSQIEHRNIARPLEAFAGPGLARRPDQPVAPGESADVCYLATIWVEGSGLREQLPIDPATVFDLVWDMAAGVDALHRRDLIHRDLHPGNVIVDGSGHAVLIDFGSTRPMDRAATATVSGVLGFIAPECLHGKETAATDRWGLGTLTTFMLLGHPQGQMREKQLRSELGTALEGIGQPGRAVDLVCQMVDTDPDVRPPDVVGWARELADCLHPISRRRRALRVVAKAAVVAVAVLGAGLAVRSFVDDPSPSATPSATSVARPGCETAVASDSAMAGAVSGLAPDDCLAGPTRTVGTATYQPLRTRDGTADGGVLLLADGTPMRLTEAMWVSFLAIVPGSAPENAVQFRGNPQGVQRLDDPPAVSLRMTGRGVMIGPRDDTQMFWIPGQVINVWREHGSAGGDLGFPLTDPYIDAEGIHLEFERGVMHAYADEAGVAAILAGGPVAPVVDHPVITVDLTAPAAVGRIVEQVSGTGWWIDEDHVRHWIPDPATWECLGGAAAVHANGLHGWDVGVLPVGPAATCG